MTKSPQTPSNDKDHKFKPADVPAKCSNYFVDHYKAQQQRAQPPEAIKEREE